MVGSTMGTPSADRLGQLGERLAAEHLRRLGYEIVELNYRTRWGELDIVARAAGTLAFCEVKTRRSGGRAGGALEAVAPAKRAQVRRIAANWLRDRTDRPFARTIRFDAIGVTIDAGGSLVSLEHLEGVF